MKYKNNLINAIYFCNGNTIYQDKTCTEVEYYHLELESHSIIVAQNMFAESYTSNLSTSHD